MIRIGIFGCTGSIGRNTIEIARHNAERIKVTALAAGGNEGELRHLARLLGVKKLALGKQSATLPCGPRALRELAADPEIDLVVNAVVGAAGLAVTLGALDGGKQLALANKESLVMAGELVMRRAAARGITIRPIDSEHAALANCLRGRREAEVARALLTASGGPFRGRPAGSFDDVSVEEALNHPTWKMGPKITIDSATLMNKGLEIIEAHHLFGLPPDKIGVVVHPQSLIHAMVETTDGSLIAEVAPPDMKIPIQRALLDDGVFASRLDLLAMKPLTFEPLDRRAFPLVDLAYESLRRGGAAATVLNAANEVAVHAFLQKKIKFGSISRIILRTFEDLPGAPMVAEEDVYEADRRAREHAAGLVRG